MKIFSFCHPDTTPKPLRSLLVYRSALTQHPAYSTAAKIIIGKNSIGKPFFLDPVDNQNTLYNPYYLSVSHSGSYSVLTTGPHPVAIDCEALSSRKHIPKMVAKLLRCFTSTLSDSAYAQLLTHFSRLPQPDQQLVFYKLWTLAEALTKFYGWTLWDFFQRRIPCTFFGLDSLVNTNIIQLNSLTAQYFIRHNHLHCVVSTATVEAEWIDHIPST